MTTNKTKDLLKAEGEKLSQLLGKLLQPEKNRHNLWIPDALWGGNGYQNYECQRCDLKKGLSLEEKEQWLTDNPCPIPCPIPLDDWNVAMKWQDWAIEEYGMIAYLAVLSEMGLRHIFDILILTLKQRLIAAAKCKENSNEESR